ncbi:MAG: iron-containing alcohol dehydrogenase [Mycoplasmatales bacterium]
MKEKIIIEAGAFKKIKEIIEVYAKSKQYVVLTDENVSAIYLEQLKELLYGLDVRYYSIKCGEETKTFETINGLTSLLIEDQIEKDATMIAFGGGVVGDIAGFVASIYVQGIKFVQIPTTLSAQVDSAVGGINGINIGNLKNIVGTTKEPELIIIDTEFMNTLSEDETKAGMIEVIKMLSLSNPRMLDELVIYEDVSSFKANISRYIKYCVNYKATILEQSQKDSSVLELLKYSDIFKVAVESATNNEVFTKAEATAHGILITNQLMVNLKLMDPIAARKIEEVISHYQIIEKPFFDVSGLAPYIIKTEFKNKTEKSFIFLATIGKPMKYKLQLEQLEQLLSTYN